MHVIAERCRMARSSAIVRAPRKFADLDGRCVRIA